MNSYLPFGFFDEVQRELGRFANARSETSTGAGQRPWLPPVDVVEQEDAYLLTMDVPGVSSESVDVTVHDGVLEIRGERSHNYADSSKLAFQERWQGKFVRRFSLPEGIDDEQIAAKVDNGVLALHLPKGAAETPRRITVQ